MRTSLLRRFIIVLIFIFLIDLNITSKVFAANVSAVSNPSTLTELNLNNATITLTLTGDQFKPTIGVSNFGLANAPVGTSIKSVSYINSTTVSIVLNFTGQDFDTDKANFYIKTSHTGLVNNSSDINSNYLPIKAMLERISVDMDPSPLRESTLNDTIMTVDLIGDTYIQNLNSSYFALVNAVKGLKIASVQRISDTEAAITLTYDGTPFSSDVTNFKVKLNHAGLVRTSTDISSSNMTIYAEDISKPGITASSKPNTLAENSLDGSTVRLTVRQYTFNSTIYPDYFTLNNAPPGTFIRRVKFINNNTVDLVLGYSNYDFDGDITNFNVTALALALSTPNPLTSSNLNLADIVEVQPGNYVNTNKSYPIDIQISGYNSKTQELHINANLYTTKFIDVGQSTIFYYYIVVYDGNGQVIGTLGKEANLEALSSTNTVNVLDQVVPLTSALTTGYRVSVVVNSVTIF